MSDANVTQRASWTVSQWCQIRAEAEGKTLAASRKAYYDAEPEERPHTVYLNGLPHITESYDEWRERTRDRWAIQTWCEIAGISPSTYRRLKLEDRPYRKGDRIIEPAELWWKRLEKRKETAAA